jgi:hypothetical protein
MSHARQMETEIVVQRRTFAHLWAIALATPKVTITVELAQMLRGLILLVRIIAWPTQIVCLLLLHIT